MKTLLAAAAVLLLGLGAANAQPPPTYEPVPPPRVEVVPPPPGGRMIWEPGHWHWDGVRYIWVGGHYVERRPHYGHYVEGHWRWSRHEGRYVWEPAHWE